jgi:hypothetical protein
VTLRNDIDVNPSVGAQFRMFETMPGINVVRAMHLDLSGRAIPAGSQIDNQRFDVEPWDIASIITQRRRPPRWTGGTGRPEPARSDPFTCRPWTASGVQSLYTRDVTKSRRCDGDFDGDFLIGCGQFGGATVDFSSAPNPNRSGAARNTAKASCASGPSKSGSPSTAENMRRTMKGVCR